jgi:hypothetical protein
MRTNNQLKYNKLREQYPVFYYDSFQYSITKTELNIQFFFHSQEINFTPKISIQFGNYLLQTLSKEHLDGLVFHIGLIELISYWKSIASPVIHIKNYSLSKQQENWWRKLYWKGLGEFFYQNSIETTESNFFNFSYDNDPKPISHFNYLQIKKSERIIVPIGGGKDSVVTLEKLRVDNKVIPFIINPRGATLDCAKIAGFDHQNNIFIIQREIDPQLLVLNNKGYLNGHTPFSAMLAFYSLLVSYITNTREIALSNESSANEATIPNTDINHQYSKSLEFELDFQYYVEQNMNHCSNYFSYLRQYSELQIAEMFSQYTQYHQVFKSCNAGSKQNKWCCNCSKCLFAYLILSPFIEDKKMIEIFGEDLLEKHEMIHFFDELTGIAPNKPFECVGTIDEVNEAVHLLTKTRKDKLLIQRYLSIKK